MHPVLANIIKTHYDAEKSPGPSMERRALTLRTLHKHWPTTPPPKDSQDDAALEDYYDDLFDYLLEDDAPGVLIRADYSNDAAWDAFHAKLKDAERDILKTLVPSPPEDEAGPSTSTAPPSQSTDVDMEGGNESDDSSDDESPPTSIITVIDPALPEERQLFDKISNIAALRLINDVDLRPAPPRPKDVKKIQPPHPLIDKNDWQEIYTGKTIWIYDDKSLKDESVRLISSSGDVYGTATGDSWRAKVAHICDLQFNMTYLGMQVNFGGLDRWDFSERQRNLSESVA